MDLSKLVTPKGATHRTKRFGRGYGSGHGKTSGRGMRGQRCRSGGGPRPGFEGGQMPLIRRIPKRGFSHLKFEAGVLSIVNLSDIVKKCAGVAEVTPEIMYSKGLAKLNSAIKVLGNGEIKEKVVIKAHAFSKTAQEKIAATGGTADVVK
ncbi:MAG: 50S ribosomal protein L15 [Elusimicrobiota bacterium]